MGRYAQTEDKMDKLVKLALDARRPARRDGESFAALVDRIARWKRRRLDTWGYATNSADAVRHLYR